MSAEEELELYRKLFGRLDEMEWSGVTYGQGSGPHGSGSDGAKYTSCRVCGGLEKGNNEFIPSAVGHRHDCRLAALLGKPTRPLELGEQGGLPL